MSVFYPGLQPALDSNGDPISGATWNFYRSGTTTPITVYSDVSLGTPIGPTITADSSGRFQVIFLSDDTQYRAILKDGAGTTITDVDPVTSASKGFRSVKAFGAVGDGVTDDLAAIEAAMDAAADDGGGTVFFPSGTYMVSNGGSGATAIHAVSNVILEGEGAASVIKLMPNMSSHTFSAVDVSNFGLRNIVIDGNRDNQSAGHGVRFEGVTGALLENVIIRQTHSYGLGIQEGQNRDVIAINLTIEDTGQDGIDIKNKGPITLQYDTATNDFAVGDVVTGATSGASGTILSLEVNGNDPDGIITFDPDTLADDGQAFTDFIDAENLQVGGVTYAKARGTLAREQNENVQFTNVTVRRWGLTPDPSPQAAIDMRGHVMIHGAFISEPSQSNASGIRARQGELLWINGTGAHESSISGIDIRMDESGVLTQVGLYVAARNVTAMGGSITGGNHCIYVIDSYFRTNFRCDSAKDVGVLFAQNVDNPGLTPHKCVFSGRVSNCASHGIQVESNDCDFANAQAESNAGYGLNITATANRTKVWGGLYSDSNASGRIADSGTDTTIIGVDGVGFKLDGGVQLVSGLMGYAAGAGGTVTQATSKTTAVTLNASCGLINVNFSSLGSGSTATFTVNNSNVTVTDTIVLSLRSGPATTGTYRYWVETVNSGAFQITIENRSGGALAEGLAISFAIIKAATA